MTRPGTLLPLLLSLLSAAAVAQNYQPDLSDPRQKTWPSPTAADWRRPCLIRWQRSWEDAVTVARKTRRPILICVNMDGEIASEHYAGVRYRHPEIAAIYNQYVCVIASVYRHNPRDYDDQGRRIPCPRFGTVTCGEHITLEPIVYKRFLDGKRIAPRHIMVELNGSEAKEIYDVYYTFDVKSVIDRVARGMKERAVKPLDIVRGDRSLVERVASRDARDREAVEKAFRKGDKELRRTLLEAAVGNRDAVPMQLFRLALFGYDLELSRVSRDALADSRNPEAIDLIAQALQVPMEEKERKSLLAALERFGEKHLKARTTAAIHRGLETGSSRIKVEEWSAKMGGSQYEPAREKSWASLVEELDSKV